MTKSGAGELAADLNKNLLHVSPYEARIIKPQVGNVRGSGYTVAIYEGARVVVPAQRERRPLLQLTREALHKWNPYYRSLLGRR